MFEKSSLIIGIKILWFLGIVFIILKLCEAIDWSWWWITFPFWGILIFMVIKILIEIIYAVAADKMEQRKHLHD